MAAFIFSFDCLFCAALDITSASDEGYASPSDQGLLVPLGSLEQLTAKIQTKDPFVTLTCNANPLQQKTIEQNTLYFDRPKYAYMALAAPKYTTQRYVSRCISDMFTDHVQRHRDGLIMLGIKFHALCRT